MRTIDPRFIAWVVLFAFGALDAFAAAQDESDITIEELTALLRARDRNFHSILVDFEQSQGRQDAVHVADMQRRGSWGTSGECVGESVETILDDGTPEFGQFHWDGNHLRRIDRAHADVPDVLVQAMRNSGWSFTALDPDNFGMWIVGRRVSEIVAGHEHEHRTIVGRETCAGRDCLKVLHHWDPTPERGPGSDDVFWIDDRHSMLVLEHAGIALDPVRGTPLQKVEIDGALHDVVFRQVVDEFADLGDGLFFPTHAFVEQLLSADGASVASHTEVRFTVRAVNDASIAEQIRIPNDRWYRVWNPELPPAEQNGYDTPDGRADVPTGVFWTNVLADRRRRELTGSQLHETHIDFAKASSSAGALLHVAWVADRAIDSASLFAALADTAETAQSSKFERIAGAAAGLGLSARVATLRIDELAGVLADPHAFAIVEVSAPRREFASAWFVDDGVELASPPHALETLSFDEFRAAWNGSTVVIGNAKPAPSAPISPTAESPAKLPAAESAPKNAIGPIALALSVAFALALLVFGSKRGGRAAALALISLALVCSSCTRSASTPAATNEPAEVASHDVGDASANGALELVGPALHELGTRGVCGVIREHFTFRNRSSSTLELETASLACGTEAPTLSTHTLEPGKFAEVELAGVTALPGELELVGSVSTRGANPSSIVFRARTNVRARAVRHLDTHPKLVDFGDIAFGSTPTSTLTLALQTWDGGDEPQFLLGEPIRSETCTLDAAPLIEAERQHGLTRWQRWTVHVRPRPDLSIGSFRETVELRASNWNASLVTTIAITGVVVGGCRADPEVLYLGVLHPGDSAVRRVRVSGGDASAKSAVEPSSSCDWIGARWTEPADLDGSRWIELSLRPSGVDRVVRESLKVPGCGASDLEVAIVGRVLAR